ncbi:MAG: site-specific DNA-methyltransferase, partial [Rhodospirillales bacterium]|nr:site-specific DNA-methyltransferase [Rhodospirillales bacterium]
VLRPGGSMYMFTAREQNGYFIRKAVERGFVYRNQLAMVKKNPLPSLSKTNWRSGFELCLYLVKPIKQRATGVAQSGPSGATFNFLSQPDCINVYPYLVRNKTTTHPTEKPLGFVRRLVEVSSRPGDLVLDPFVGSGTTAVAAKTTGRDFLGFDTSPEYVKMARRRIRLANYMAAKEPVDWGNSK